MISISALFTQLLTLFIVICVGFLAFRKNLLNESSISYINRLILNVNMPMMMINSVLAMEENPSGSTVGFAIIFSLLLYIILPFIAFAAVKLMRKTIKIKKERQGLYMFMLVFGNIGYIGIPILQSVCGENASVAVFYAAILNIFFNIGIFTYGIFMIGYGAGINAKFSLKSLFTPGMICSVLALVFFFLDISFPTTVENAIELLGDMTPGLAMIVVGATLGSMNLKEVFSEAKVYIFVLIKQIILPILLYPLLRIIIKDDLYFTVIFIEIQMPVANTALMLATEYKLDSKFVSKNIFMTTLFSMVTIPLVYYLCTTYIGNPWM